jgi:hypothetical protein
MSQIVWGECDRVLTGCRWLPDFHERKISTFEGGYLYLLTPPFPVDHRLLNGLLPEAIILFTQRICFLYDDSISPNPQPEGPVHRIYNPGAGCPILVASYDTHRLRWDYSHSRPPHGNARTATPASFAWICVHLFFTADKRARRYRWHNLRMQPGRNLIPQIRNFLSRYIHKLVAGHPT